MQKVTKEMKNEKSIKNLQRVLKQAEKAIAAGVMEAGKLLQRIRFLESLEVARHESNIRGALKYRELGYLKEEQQKAWDATMNYKFPNWIEEDRLHEIKELIKKHLPVSKKKATRKRVA